MVKIQSISRLLVIFSILLSDCKKDKTKDITKEELYQTLNEILISNSIQLDTVCSSLLRFDFNNDAFVDEFSDFDKQFAMEQYKKLKLKTIVPNKLQYFDKETNRINKSFVKQNCFKGFTNVLSVPIISADRSKVLLRIESKCNCLFGSEGSTFLFVKRQKKWIILRKFNSYTSLIDQEILTPNTSQAI